MAQVSPAVWQVRNVIHQFCGGWPPICVPFQSAIAPARTGRLLLPLLAQALKVPLSSLVIQFDCVATPDMARTMSSSIAQGCAEFAGSQLEGLSGQVRQVVPAMAGA